jgi:transcriptional regulator with XRE-family HTH domain
MGRNVTATRPRPTKIGRRVTARRLELGKTQEQVSREIGVAKRYVGALETGRIQYSTNHIIYGLSLALLCDAKELVRERGSKKYKVPQHKLGKLILKGCADCNISLETLSQKMKVYFPYFHRIVYGKYRRINLAFAKGIASELNLPIKKLLLYVYRDFQRGVDIGTPFSRAVSDRCEAMGIDALKLAQVMLITHQSALRLLLGEVVPRDRFIKGLESYLKFGIGELELLVQTSRPPRKYGEPRIQNQLE